LGKYSFRSNEEIVVLIPAAGSIKSACNYDLSFKNPAFLNIGSTLAIEEIRNKLDYKIILAVEDKENYFYKFKPFLNIQVINVGNTESITETIKKALNLIDAKMVLINPITSIPTDNKINSSFIEFGSLMLPKENWSSLTFDNDGIPIFHSKFEQKSKGLESYPFTGRIFANKNDLISVIKDLKGLEKEDLICLASELFFREKLEIKFSNWLDIGHIATYPLTKVSTIKSRYFNFFDFDISNNVLIKKSENKLKIENEIEYYQTIPSELKRYFPTLINVKKTEKLISYELDYIAKPSLSEIYLFSEIGPNAIKRIINSLKRIFDNFYDKKPIVYENASWLYSKKCSSREKQILKIIDKEKFSILKRIYFKEFIVNKFSFPPLKETYKLLKGELKLYEKNRPIHLGHGDLCFNNILIDPIYGEVNLIDPKAQKHQELGINGLIDSFYDLAKLNHSIEGLYDSIVNNLFNLKEIRPNKFQFEVYKPKEYEVFNYFFKELILYNKISENQLRVITGNLFLTMLPMHFEDPERIIAFAFMGNILIHKCSTKKFIL